jgi:hypothetical protein
MSLLWINTSDLIYQLLCKSNPRKLVVLTPHCSPYTPRANCDYVNTSNDYINTFANFVDKSINYAHTSNNCVNTSVDSIDARNTPTLDVCILDSSLLQLSFNDYFVIWSSKVNTILTLKSSIHYSSLLAHICGCYFTHSPSSTSVS